MIKQYCDRCGKEIQSGTLNTDYDAYSGFHHPFINVYSRHGYTDGENTSCSPQSFRVDLCDGCFMNLRDWLGFKDEKEKRRWI